uniref:NADH dehydrogenase subunit 6 n=1 Tax=Brachyrhynchus triangulus TaxID=1452780 RepID=UPI001FF67D30|nr:NADH dehydrogenase subunit 6 [Brachyrhynchus triangulus]UOG86760.1 NADH dehydrogenase subunit 6 [Brachyrhynchus triangulus]UPL65815.1 NADH dehydrogenase subunit 6 [Brachyrhynchus triangulus]
MKLITSMIMSMSIMLPLTKTPMSSGGVLVISSMAMAVMIGFMMNTFMFSYILVIIMMSGVMVLFIYMSVISSNKKFKPSFKATVMLVMSMIMMYMITEPQETPQHKDDQLMVIGMLVNWQITMMAIMLLLLIMIVSVIMITTSKGPLRMKT